MSGDGQTDVVIPMVFLFGAEAGQLMDALHVHTNLVVYMGETARQSSMSTKLYQILVGQVYNERQLCEYSFY